MQIFLLLALLFSALPAWADDCGFDAAKNEDYAAALKPLTECAEQGSPGAQLMLAIMYDNGLGVPQDDKAAVHWYALSAKQGLADAQGNLGLMYVKGRGMPQDYKAAVRWFTLSAKQGLANAQYNLGVMYSSGDGVPQDYVLAHMWVNLAASNGDNETSVKVRDALASLMTPAQIAEAQALAQRCLTSKYKECGR